MTTAPHTTASGAADRYTKKPVTIEAIRWTGKNLREVIAFTNGPPDTRTSHAGMAWDTYVDLVERDGLKIFTLEGKMSAAVGDWIIKGVKGEIYPCKDEIFEATYSPALAASAPVAPAVGNSGFDYKTAADLLNGKTVRDEAIRKFVAASRWAHDDSAGLRATLISARGELASREAEIALLKKTLMDAEPAPPAQEVLLNPDMPTQELRLHMGELTSDEVLVARAAIRWANTYGITAAQKETPCAPTP